MYTITEYGVMLADRSRLNAYDRALQAVVKPGSVVLEVGTGTGLFAILACQYGANKVYAIEPNDAIEVARQLARENGCADKIIFIQDLAKNVSLPEKVSVAVSDMRGILPLFRHHLPSIIDVRRRMLAPGGTMIPAQDSLWAALVSSPSAHRELLAPWQEKNYAVDMHSVSQLATNNIVSLRAPYVDEQLLVEPKSWAILDYYTIDDPDMAGRVSWNVERESLTHGIKVWFDTRLTRTIGFSNADVYPGKIYGSYFFPWPQEVLLHKGDEISISLRANLIDDDYIWCWDTCIHSHHGSQVKETVYEQSTFKGTPLSLPRIKKRAESYTPVLNEEGLIDKQILFMMEAGRPLHEIARKVCDRFPGYFNGYQQALNHVGKLSLKYSK